jgi:gas vesicle protein
MKKITLTLALAAFMLSAVEVVAQDTTAPQTEERSGENIKKEADALKTRIDQYTEKVEANKDKVDYEAETVRINRMKVRWEKLTGKDWEREKELEKM